MSVEEARAYSDQLYPPTADDITYEERQRHTDEGRSAFPWLSALSLIYPISATIYIATRTPAPTVVIAGYGLANLGYLLFAAGIFAGRFGVLGLKRRWQVIFIAIVCFALGTILSSIST
jgi:hypothetical protein